MNILRMNMSDENKENSDNREEQTDGKPVEKYCFTCNQSKVYAGCRSLSFEFSVEENECIWLCY